MLFLFPAPIETKKLYHPLGQFARLMAESPVTEIREMKISFLGFSEEAQWQIVSRDGRSSQHVFQRGHDGNAYIDQWKLEGGRSIVENDEPFHPWSSMLKS